MRFFVNGLLLVVTILWIGPSEILGQEADQPDDGQLETLTKEFRELVIQNALNSESPARRRAISLLQRRGYTDARFDDQIRESMAVNKESGLDRFARRSIAVALMPHSTLSESEQVSLLLDQLSLENEQYPATVPEIDIKRFGKSRYDVEMLVNRLSEFPDELAAQLKKRLSDKAPLAIFCAAAGLTKETGRNLLPLLLKAAKSKDQAVQNSALASADVILLAIERKRRLADEVDPKHLKYASRIVERYDKNEDGLLEPDEWEEMLMSPKPADSNNDGRVTKEEYARFLQHRTPRQ